MTGLNPIILATRHNLSDMSYILGICASGHDASACLFKNYELIAAVGLERLSRIKSEGERTPIEAIREVLEIGRILPTELAGVALSRSHFPVRYFDYRDFPLVHRVRRGFQAFDKEKTAPSRKEASIVGQPDLHKIFRASRFLRDAGLPENLPLRFYDHHLAHGLPALFHNPAWEDALLYTADGGAETGFYSFRHFHQGRLDTIFGGEEMFLGPHPVSSLALAYGFATQALGYKINRHEGKLTGLAARGKPVHFDDLRSRFKVDSMGRILATFPDHKAMRRHMNQLAAKSNREDVSASVQQLVEVVGMESIRNLQCSRPARHIGLSGGLFANVRLNQCIADSGLFETVFVYPAMSDQGISVGGALNFLLERDGMEKWLSQRHLLSSLYLGRDYTQEIDRLFSSSPEIIRDSDSPVEATAKALIQGQAVAIYTSRMEFGPRALGARTVLASPVARDINDSLNARMDRSEFMPFAPVVLEEYADEVLELPSASRYSARFMTITCPVRPHWRERIPAVVHVDGTARPQLLRRTENPLYYDILTAFHQHTGIPVLVNTSFNVHEEPIINSPSECLRALVDDRVDAVVTTKGLYRAKNPVRPATNPWRESSEAR